MWNAILMRSSESVCTVEHGQEIVRWVRTQGSASSSSPTNSGIRRLTSLPLVSLVDAADGTLVEEDHVVQVGGPSSSSRDNL